MEVSNGLHSLTQFKGVVRHTLSELRQNLEDVELDVKAVEKFTKTNFNDNYSSTLDITLKPSIHDYWKKSIIRKKIREILNKGKKKGILIHYLLVEDYSETGRMHYHGVIIVNDIEHIQKYRAAVARAFGRTELCSIRHYDECINYMYGIYDDDHVKRDARIGTLTSKRIITDLNDLYELKLIK